MGRLQHGASLRRRLDLQQLWDLLRPYVVRMRSGHEKKPSHHIKRMLVTASCARDSYGVTFPGGILHPPWCYLYDVVYDRWVFIGAPLSPRSVIW